MGSSSVWMEDRSGTETPSAALALYFLFTFSTIYFKAQLSAKNRAISDFGDAVLIFTTGEGKTSQDFVFAPRPRGP